MEKLKYIAPIILRYGMVAVFLWFGTQQLIDSKNFTAYVPDAIANMLSMSKLYIVYINGAMEVILGTMLLLGVFTRIVSGVLAFHMFSILLAVGYGQTGVRDLGLFISTIVVSINGKDDLCVDKILEKNKI